MSTFYEVLNRYIEETETQLLLASRQMGLVRDTPQSSKTKLYQSERVAHRLIGPNTVAQAMMQKVQVAAVLENPTGLNTELLAQYYRFMQRNLPFIEALYKRDLIPTQQVTTLFSKTRFYNEGVQNVTNLRQSHSWHLWQAVADLEYLLRKTAAISSNFMIVAQRDKCDNVFLQTTYQSLWQSIKALIDHLSMLKRLNFSTLSTDVNHVQLMADIKALPEDYAFLLTPEKNLSTLATPLWDSVTKTNSTIHFRAIHQDKAAQTAFSSLGDRPDFSITFKKSLHSQGLSPFLIFNLQPIEQFYSVFYSMLQQSIDLHAKQGLLRLLSAQLALLTTKAALKLHRSLYDLVLTTLKADAENSEQNLATTRHVLADLLLNSREFIAKHIPWHKRVPTLNSSLTIIHERVMPINQLLSARALKSTLTFRTHVAFERQALTTLKKTFPLPESVTEHRVSSWLDACVKALNSKAVAKSLQAAAQLRALFVLKNDRYSGGFKRFIVHRDVYESLYKLMLQNEILREEVFQALGDEIKKAFINSVAALLTEVHPVSNFKQRVYFAAANPIMYSWLPNFLRTEKLLQDYFEGIKKSVSAMDIDHYDPILDIMETFERLPNHPTIIAMYIKSLMDSFSQHGIYRFLKKGARKCSNFESASRVQRLIALCQHHTTDRPLAAKLAVIIDPYTCISEHFEDSITLTVYLSIDLDSSKPVVKLQRLWKECSDDVVLKERFLLRLSSCFLDALKDKTHLASGQSLLTAEILAFILACSHSFKENHSKTLLKQVMKLIVTKDELKKHFLVENAVLTPAATHCFSLSEKSVSERFDEEKVIDDYFSECQRHLRGTTPSQSPVTAEKFKRLWIDCHEETKDTFDRESPLKKNPQGTR